MVGFVLSFLMLLALCAVLCRLLRSTLLLLVCCVVLDFHFLFELCNSCRLKSSPLSSPLASVCGGCSNEVGLALARPNYAFGTAVACKQVKEKLEEKRREEMHTFYDSSVRYFHCHIPISSVSPYPLSERSKYFSLKTGEIK